MGSWGTDAFANDTALDFACELTGHDQVVAALQALIDAHAHDSWPRDLDEIAIGFAAATVVAYARSGSTRYQSFGTTLFACGDDGKLDESVVVPYVPEEVRSFLESDSARFSDEEARLALVALDCVSAEDQRAGWNDPDEREQAVDRVRQRIAATC